MTRQIRFEPLPTTDMKPELKPCAHCGKEAHFGEVHEEGSDNDGGEFIECTNPMCGMSTLLMFPAMDEVKTLLAERWNARAENDKAEAPSLGEVDPPAAG